jgi:predicted HTH domain antitoxin
MRTIEVPDELLDLLKGSRLAGRSETDRVKSALAIHLFQEGLVSIGKAAALVGMPRVEFEWLLVEMGIPVARFDVADYEVDKRGIAAVEQHETS